MSSRARSQAVDARAKHSGGLQAAQAAQLALWTAAGGAGGGGGGGLAVSGGATGAVLGSLVGRLERKYKSAEAQILRLKQISDVRCGVGWGCCCCRCNVIILCVFLFYGGGGGGGGGGGDGGGGGGVAIVAVGVAVCAKFGCGLPCFRSRIQLFELTLVLSGPAPL